MKTEKKVFKQKEKLLESALGGLQEELVIPEELPVLPLLDTVIYPQMVTALGVSTERELKLLDYVLTGNRLLALALQKNQKEKEAGPEDLYGYATAAVVLQMLKMPDNSARMLVQGITRLKLTQFVREEPYLVARVETLEDVVEEDKETEALTRSLSDQFIKMISMSASLPDELKIAVMNIEHPGRLADMIASHLSISVHEKEEVLEAVKVKERLKKVNTLISKEMEVLELARKIQGQVKSELDKGQKEYYLRQQLKAIQDELGETDERTVEVQELKQKITQAKMPPEVLKEAERELSRLQKMPPQAAEYTVSRTYLDWLVSLPWSVTTTDNLDINQAQKVLDEDHYDLKRVKDRILEYLAVRKLKPDMKGPILCFVGPPGTGKTSLGKSIARSLGRKFIRISLGGIRDEAEIRGHRRTYIGALPGRIIQSIRKAESNNPVFMLDEIDKLGMDFRGDPSSALLEVLDPEQNFSFSDHYLEVPFDLTKVMFITTANYLEPVPPALKDRMEVLELPGYTEEEKLSIAKEFLIPKQTKEHGLKPENISFEESAIKSIISNYTREAGLRNLERAIATVCRKVAKEIAAEKAQSMVIKEETLGDLLGPIAFFKEIAERTAEPGVATGLAWTPTGGDILFIESTYMPGTGKLTLTGQLGEVMKESAEAAMSYVRSRSKALNVPLQDFTKYDFHIHVPAGAIPKDGPSAGVTIAMSLLSLLTGKSVRPEVAMTGEITLRGRVLPVGGIKEKVLAAKRAGIATLILPKRNEKDLVEVTDEVKARMEFRFVEKVDEMLPTVFGTLEPAREKEEALVKAR
ncbi:MAG TPA: endopeptidase La [Candidatus Tripitaka californicus]|uniref:endopeptidase La n=1 Tax=Candidatus Tripitaka californicus TaxID=3367616 RepID=UPI0040270F35|nr:endopeptidase La [Planctomycetota bacterium]